MPDVAISAAAPASASLSTGSAPAVSNAMQDADADGDDGSTKVMSNDGHALATCCVGGLMVGSILHTGHVVAHAKHRKRRGG